MFLKASRERLRFTTDKGLLSVEDLWALSLQQLNKIAKALNKELKVSAEEDFLGDTSVEDTITKLRFDIVLKIIEIKKEEAKVKREASSRKERKQKLLGILAEKEDDVLKGMTPEEIRKELADLG